MRVVFDAYWWLRGPQSNRGVLRDLVATWREEFPGDRIALAVPARDRLSVAAEVGDDVELVPLRLWPHGVAIALELPMRVRGRDRVILSHNFTPWSGRSAVLIQDVLFVEHPQWFTRAERLYFSLMPATARRASAVLATTRDQAAAIGAATGRGAEVHVVGLGLSRELLAATPTPPDLPLSAGGFVLVVGRLNVRKNLDRAARAAVASGRLSADLPLVVVGEAGGRSTEFDPTVRAAIDDGRVILAGHIGTDHLAWLFENAGLVLFLSLGEGYGLPPVEARAFGARVLASDIPVLREVVGPDARYVDPLDEAAIAAAIASADIGLDNDEIRAERRADARGRAAWPATVGAIRDVLGRLG